MAPKPPLKKGVPSKARRGIFKNQVKKQMLYYQSKNKANARFLRSNQTDAEQRIQRQPHGGHVAEGSFAHPTFNYAVIVGWAKLSVPTNFFKLS